jgi:hypothetical protein
MKKTEILQKKNCRHSQNVVLHQHVINRTVKQRKTLRYLTFINYCIRLAAPDQKPTLAKELLNQTLKSTHDESQSNEFKLSHNKESVM